jgi:DNA-binding NarL/FixJ family response regulator
MAKVRVLLADDHTMVVEAFKKLLESEFEIVGTASDGRKLMQLAQQTKPDVILLDLGMAPSGFDAGRQLKRLLPAAKIVVVTMNDDLETAQAALREWASGYIIKSSAGAELRRAIADAMGGRPYVSPRIASWQTGRFIKDPRMPKARALTQRKRQVLQLLAEGRTMKETAAALQLSIRTVEFHKYQLMEEYGLKNHVDLVRFAMKQHVVA